MAAKTAERNKKKPAPTKPGKPKPSARGKSASLAARKGSSAASKGKPDQARQTKSAPSKAKGLARKPVRRAPQKPVAKAHAATKAFPGKADQRTGKAQPTPGHRPEKLDQKAFKKPAGKGAEPAPAKGKAAKPLVRRKLMVGQKPRSAKPSEAIVPSTILAQQKAQPSVNSPSIKATPASVEAKQSFKVNDSIVYPAHGVGRIVAIEKQVIAGIANELFLIEFEQEKMKLRVPTAKAKAVGMRGLSENSLVKKAIETLKGRARIKRTMWSRRAQEYEQKINSGDIMQVAEVVRDLFRASDQPEQSYSERQLFEAALDRLAREVAAVHRSDLAKAIGELEAALAAKKAA
jgi:CarD family transcriptional regulator